jgi:hypothetical protein
MVFGFVIAFFLLVASVAFWPDKSKKQKTPALIVLTIIYVSGTGGLSLAERDLSGSAMPNPTDLISPRAPTPRASTQAS